MGAYTTLKRSSARNILLIGTISVANWLVVITGRYLLWLEYYDYSGKKLILACSFTIAVISMAVLVVLLRRSRSAWAYAISFAMVALIVAVVLLPWNSIFGRTWFAANHAKFVTLANAARQGKLHADSSGWFERQDASSLTFNHGAQDVPIEVSPGRALMLSMSNEEVSENMYLYVYDRPDAARLNPCKLKETTFDDYYRCTLLGDSWWWLQRKY